MKALVSNADEDTGLIAQRSLAHAGFEVIGMGTRPLPAAARSRYADAYYRIEPGEQPAFEQRLLRLVERVRPDVFLPLGTYGVRAAASQGEALAAITAVNVVDQQAFQAAFEKDTCMAECLDLGIPAPATYSKAEARELLRGPGRGLTLVVKPRRDVGAATDVHYVSDAGRLEAATRVCLARHGGYMIQEFIPGGVETMKTVVLLFGPTSRLSATFTMRKVRQWPRTGGPTAVGLSTAEPDLVELVLPFFRKWRWRGPAEVELKLDPRDGRHKVIEINPRFPGYLRFPWHCGLDLPLLATRLALGDDCGDVLPGYRVGLTWMAPRLFLQTLRDDLRSHGLRTALRNARIDAAGAAPVVRGMLADPLPQLVRLFRATRPSITEKGGRIGDRGVPSRP